MDILTIFSLLLIHWVADFVLQSHEMATKKSTDNIVLSEHVYTYILVWSAAAIIYVMTHLDTFSVMGIIGFLVITFVCHWTTDYFTSKWVKHFFTKGDYHNGFVIIGLDQILHYVQIFLCFYYLL